MAEKERIGKAIAETLNIKNGGVLINDAPLIAGGATRLSTGQVAITGSVVVASGLASIVSVIATINQADATADQTVTATWSGSNLTLSVWTSSEVASSTPTVVSFLAAGN